MFITKIRLKGDKTAVVNYETGDTKAVEKREYKGNERVTDDFKNAFIQMRDTFVAIIPKLRADVNKIMPTEVNFEYKDNGLKSISYTVSYLPTECSNTILSISTPKLPVDNPKLKASQFYINGSDLDLVEKIQTLAEKYMNGETETIQMKLTVV